MAGRPASWPTSETTIKLARPMRDRTTLAALRATLPALEPITEEREVIASAPPPAPSAHHDTPHTFVLPLASNADRATLTMLRGHSVGATFSLEHEETILGRSETADITLDDSSVSRRHARVVVEGGRYFIEDLASTNGTFLAGAPVKRAPLKNGDRVQIGGEHTFRFALMGEDEETLQRRIYESSMRDGLTSLLNHRCLFEHLAVEIERSLREKADLGVLMIDVDRFKEINDRFGHAAGDQVLRAIALTGAATLRETDLFARYGGEEFAVLVRGAERADLAALAERLRSAIAAMGVEVGGGSVHLTVSIGVALLSECEIIDGLELFARADARLYAAKASGRNRVCVDD
jgi:two-component system cell cycle response regulator